MLNQNATPSRRAAIRSAVSVITLSLALLMAGCAKTEVRKVEEVDPNKTDLNEYQMKQITLDTAHVEEERSEIRFPRCS